MPVSIHRFVVDSLNACRGEWPHVVAETGVPMSTVARIANGETENPGVKHIEALATYFRWLEKITNKQVKRGESERRAAPG